MQISDFDSWSAISIGRPSPPGAAQSEMRSTILVAAGLARSRVRPVVLIHAESPILRWVSEDSSRGDVRGRWSCLTGTRGTRAMRLVGSESRPTVDASGGRSPLEPFQARGSPDLPPSSWLGAFRTINPGVLGRFLEPPAQLRPPLPSRRMTLRVPRPSSHHELAWADSSRSLPIVGYARHQPWFASSC